jgi:hypothetical protein
LVVVLVVLVATLLVVLVALVVLVQKRLAVGSEQRPCAKRGPPSKTWVGMYANKIIRTYDLIGNIIGKGMILLGGTWGGGP